MRLVVLGLNHKTVPVTIREQFAVSEESARSGLRHLDEQSGINEAVILSTCNRTEIYAVLGDAGSREGLMKFSWLCPEIVNPGMNISSIMKERNASVICLKLLPALIPWSLAKAEY